MTIYIFLHLLIYPFVSFLHSLVSFWIIFFPAFRIHFSGFLFVFMCNFWCIYYFTFCQSKNVFILLVVLKIMLLIMNFLDWQLFSICIIKDHSMTFWLSTFLLRNLLSYCYFFEDIHFSQCFNIFFLPLVFSSFTLIHLGVVSFVFIHLGTFRAF